LSTRRWPPEPGCAARSESALSERAARPQSGGPCRRHGLPRSPAERPPGHEFGGRGFGAGGTGHNAFRRRSRGPARRRRFGEGEGYCPLLWLKAPMPRDPESCRALPAGQLARRWRVSVERVRQLVAGGHLPGAFTIPSAGRYGAALRVPLAAVLRVETEDWAVTPEPARARPRPRRRGGDAPPALRHFPNLRATPEPASG